MHPLLNEERFVGALYDPLEGHIDPSGRHPCLRQGRKDRRGGDRALHPGHRPAAPPRRRLGRHHRQRHHPGRACGQRRRSLGAGGRPHGGAGTAHPGDGAPVSGDRRDPRGGRARDRTAALHRPSVAKIYMRQERSGLVMGTYEKGGRCPGQSARPPWDFGHELLQPDLDRISDNLEVRLRPLPGAGRGGASSR